MGRLHTVQYVIEEPQDFVLRNAGVHQLPKRRVVQGHYVERQPLRAVQPYALVENTDNPLMFVSSAKRQLILEPLPLDGRRLAEDFQGEYLAVRVGDLVYGPTPSVTDTTLRDVGIGGG